MSQEEEGGIECEAAKLLGVVGDMGSLLLLLMEIQAEIRNLRTFTSLFLSTSNISPGSWKMRFEDSQPPTMQIGVEMGIECKQKNDHRSS